VLLVIHGVSFPYFVKVDNNVHLGIPALLEFFRHHRDEDALVLATIVATEGSTYRKPGAMMLISAEGAFEGMISGGCLEGDLLHHAAKVFASGQPAFVTYDMHAGEDLVWSLGLGCDGVIHLLLQRLDRENNFGLLDRLAASQQSRKACLVALTLEVGPGLPCGTLAWLDNSDISEGEPFLQQALRASARPWPQWRTQTVLLENRENTVRVMLVNIPARTRVLICGAGPDAVPVAQALCQLDWEVLVVDHRPAFAKAERFPAGCTVMQCRPEQLSATTDLSKLDAVVIMSHHLENDSAYLGQVADFTIPYIAVLGPAARRDRLRTMAGCEALDIKGPAGLDIGAELPAAVALSIAAEVHAVLNRRDGQSLTLKTREKG
jgi:xanthine/CO dehydrogenase XdhC/CoxF family maturation factor